MPSTPQSVAMVQVYDYAMRSGDPALTLAPVVPAGTKVTVTLNYRLGRSAAPVTWVTGQTVYATTTDGNGYWTVFVVPNNKINPANTYYIVEVEGFLSYKIQVTDVGVPAGGWQSSAPGILLDVPAALAPTTSTVGAITATGLITAQAGIVITAGGLTVAGGETATGSLTVDTLFYSTAVSRLIPGATSFSVRDNANANDNLIVTNAGNVTTRGSLTVLAGGAAVTGNSTVTGTLTVTAGLTVSAGGAAITGNSTVTGTLTVTAALTANSTSSLQGDVTLGARLLFSTAVGKIVPGATSLSHRNTADSADNLLITDAGLVTLRNALLIPPIAGGTVAASNYGTVPVKIAEILPAGAVATVTFSSIPGGGRNLRLYGYIVGVATTGNVLMQFNADVAANYDYQSLTANNATLTGVGNAAQTSLRLAAILSTATGPSSFEAVIFNYASTGFRRTYRAHEQRQDTDAAAGVFVGIYSGLWRNTVAAITSLTVFASGNITNGSYLGLEMIP